MLRQAHASHPRLQLGALEFPPACPDAHGLRSGSLSLVIDVQRLLLYQKSQNIDKG
jgi:hypothetical protein